MPFSVATTNDYSNLSINEGCPNRPQAVPQFSVIGCGKSSSTAKEGLDVHANHGET